MSVDRHGYVSPHASVIEFPIGSFVARLCDACARQLRELLKRELV